MRIFCPCISQLCDGPIYCKVPDWGGCFGKKQEPELFEIWHSNFAHTNNAENGVHQMVSFPNSSTGVTIRTGRCAHFFTYLFIPLPSEGETCQLGWNQVILSIFSLTLQRIASVCVRKARDKVTICDPPCKDLRNADNAVEPVPVETGMGFYQQTARSFPKRC